MIITIKGADFSAKNIGTLDTWTIFTTLGSGATYSGDRVVEKDSSLSATITIADGYELGSAGVSVIMGATDVTSSAATVSGNTITINIAAVTGNVIISVPTINTSDANNYTMLSEREYPDTNVNINATSKAGDSLEIVAKFKYGRQANPTGKKQLLAGSNMGVLMMISPETKVMMNNISTGTYALTEGSEYYMKIKLVPSGSKSVMTSTVYSGTDATLSSPLDTIARDITNATPYPLYVGNSQVTTAATLADSMNSGIKIKEFWVYKPSGTLIFNGVPAKRNSDNAYGLYDSVTQTFFAEEKIITQ